MRQPEEFDAFYKDARDRLLVQTFAMTGDVEASRRAVREAFVVAWHRWRKLSRLERPEDVVRPHAWRLAQRRHTARMWHRERDLDAEVKATLDALGKLSATQRRTLVLTQLAAVSMPQMAREVGVTLERAEQELQSAASALSLARDVTGPELPLLFEQLGAAVAGRGQFPRATIIRRSGAARRRSHTLVGAAAAVAAVVVSGALVTDAAGVRPTLEAADRPEPHARPSASPRPTPDMDDPVELVLPDTTLLTAPQVEEQYEGRTWSAAGTGDNSQGSGLVLPCQQSRYADPRGAASLVRSFDGEIKRGRAAAATAVQLTEASAAEPGARRTFRATSRWFGDCREPRVQLLGTRIPGGVGDESVQIVLRSWAEPVTTYVVGIARTGIYTTTTAVSLPGSAMPDRNAGAALLAGAVSQLCALPDAGACAEEDPGLTSRDPLPAGGQPSMLSEIDLPPLPGVTLPWVGTEPQLPATNAAATSCDRTRFDQPFKGTRLTRAATRTFVVPGAKVPEEFGLTETVAALPVRQAKAFVEEVRADLTSCPDRDLAADVDLVVRRDDAGTALTAWRIDVRVSDERSVTFLMAIMRRGDAVAQLGFVPGPRATISDASFIALAERSMSRLGSLPAPSAS